MSLEGTSKPLVSVVIPAWNAAEDLSDCIESVFASTYSSVEVIVVDNASTDATPGLLASRFPDVKAIRNQENIGFGGALNQGSRVAAGEYVVWLNSDAVLPPRWIEQLVNLLETDSRLGMATSVVTYREPENIVWSAGGWVDATTGLTWDHGKGEDVGAISIPSNPDYLAACATMIRRKVLETLGGLDASYFIYFEDADLCLRLKTAGYRIAVLDNLAVRHSATSRAGVRKNPASKLFLFARSNLRFILKNWPSPRLPLAIFACLVFYLSFALIKGPRELLPSVLRAITWNVRYLDHTLRARGQGSKIRIRSRVPGLLQVALKLAQRPELYPY